MKITNRWFIVFLILPHLSIYYLRISAVEPVTLMLQSLVIPMAVVILMKTMKVNRFNVLMLFSMMIILASSLIHGTITPGIVFTIGVFIGFCIYLSYAIKDFKEMIIGLYYLSAFVVGASFLSLFFPVQNDVSGEMMYFLGGKNQIAMTMVPATAIIYIYSLTKFKKLRVFPFTLILLGLLSTYIAGSGTGVVIVILLAVFVFSPLRKFASYNGYLTIYFALFFSVVIYRLHEVLFGNFIVNYLGKDLTFTNRTTIWDVVIQTFKESWVGGVGRGNTVIAETITFLDVNEAHNGMLQVMLETGILGVIALLLILFAVGKKVKINKNHLFSQILSFSIFAYLIIGLTESAFHRKEFWLLLVLAYGLNEIVGQVGQIDLLKSKTKKRSSIKRKRLRITW